MVKNNKVNSNTTAKSFLTMIASLVFVVLLLSSCSVSQDIKGKESSLIKENVTAGGEEVVYPDAPPSSADGKAVWQKLNCAVCHGTSGTGVSGKTSLNLADKFYMTKQTPVDQYKFLVYGKANLKHPTIKQLVSPKEAWNLVFYVRSLSRPPLTAKEIEVIAPVFGSNCAVCHGTKGYGDGPVGRNFEPMPANFQNFSRFYDRSDMILYDHIANGIRWEGMPNFLGKEDKAKNIKFDQAYIWKLVDYVRHFHETGASATPPST